MLLFLSGCCTNYIQHEACKVRPTFNCQDYANAWSRCATEKGFDCGVLWYIPEKANMAHAICWVHDSMDVEFYVEPQNQKIIQLTKKEKKSIFLKTKGPVSQLAHPYFFNILGKE